VDLGHLNGMHHTPDAGHRSGNRDRCLKGTRGDVLQQLERWLKDERDQRVFWLNGLAGTGKSTVAQTFAATCFADGDLGATYFCSRDADDRSNLQNIIPTLAFQLAYRYSGFREELLKLLKTDPDVGRESLSSQMEKLVVGPFKTTQIRTLIIIDALDECKDKQPESAILFVLSKYVDQIPNVKFFITGRPETHVRSGFRLPSLEPVTKVFNLHEVERSIVDNDIKLFFRRRLADISRNRSDCDLTTDWPSPPDIDILCKKAAGLFIYAETVVKFIASKDHLPTERLKLITSFPQRTAEEGKSGIDDLYTQLLEEAFCNICVDDKEFYHHFRSVVGSVLLVFNPLQMKTFSTLLKTSKFPTTLRSLHSVFLVPKNSTGPVRVFHKSFPDFLTDPERCKDERFFINPSVHHQEVLLSCLNLMKERLKRNICGLDDFVSLKKVNDLSACQKAHIGDALEYACRFWTRHLAEIPSSSYDGVVHKAIDKFFTTQLPYWIEVLCLMGDLDVGVHAINDVDKWYTLVSCGLSTH
jgi:hypothetical protein